MSYPCTMKVEALGDSAWIVRDLGEEPAFAYATYLQSLDLPGVTEVVASYDTLGVYVEPGQFSLPKLRLALEGFTPSQHKEGRHHRIPVCYELGEDLERCCQDLA